MATLHEYFVRDSAQNLSLDQRWTMTDQAGTELGVVLAKLLIDFEARAKYIAFYIPAMKGVELPEAFALNSIGDLLKAPETTVGVSIGGFGEDQLDGKDCIFTGQVYLYSERPVPDEHKERLMQEAKAVGQRLTFRSTKYAEERTKYEKPLAFISHDSRDKTSIAEPLAIQLYKWGYPVWFDKYALRVGDSLRESIERGLKECPKCVLILTPNFLKNGGWPKREYSAVFTKELVEGSKVILPVWSGVTRDEVYEYSPVLADRYGANWNDGVEEVARKLIAAIGGR